MPLPKSWTTVTPLSKSIAMILFVLFPLLGFFFGVRYQQRLDEPQLQKVSKINSTRYDNTQPTKNSLLTYTNDVYHFSLQYPAELVKEESTDHTFVGFDTAPTSGRVLFSVNVELTKLTPKQWWSQIGYRKYSWLFNTGINSVSLPLSSNPYTEITGIEIVGQTKSPGGATLSSEVSIFDTGNYLLVFYSDGEVTASQVFSSFKLLQTTPSPTCIPRPACLDATPRCMIPESSNMCPKAH